MWHELGVSENTGHKIKGEKKKKKQKKQKKTKQKLYANEMKIIILEYSFILLFESFNGGNEKSIPLFGILSRREWNGKEGTLIPLYFFKISNFHSPWNWDE